MPVIDIVMDAPLFCDLTREAQKRDVGVKECAVQLIGERLKEVYHGK